MARSRAGIPFAHFIAWSTDRRDGLLVNGRGWRLSGQAYTFTSGDVPTILFHESGGFGW